jgi:cytochrome c5
MKTAILVRQGRRLPLAALLVVLFPLAGHTADRSGKEVVDTVCITCHGPGKDGAPRIDDRAEWAKRAAKGLDKLNENAITGVRKMPAHGGQAALTDLEMTRGVAYLVSGGAAADPQKPYTPARIRSGEQVVKERCQECHADGRNGAPRIGDIDAWKPRLRNGVAPLVNSAIGGHKGMPARGGMASLSDAEIRAAVNYMVGQTAGAAVKNH